MQIPNKYRLTIIMLVILFLGSTFSVYGKDLERILENSDYSKGDTVRIQHLFNEAERERVPEKLLLPRLQEGIAKHIPASRLVQTLRKELNSLKMVRDLLEKTQAGKKILTDQSRWARAANLLDSGREESELMALVAVCKKRPEAFRPIAALYVSILDWGLDKGDSLALIQAAVDSDLSLSEYPGITKLIAEGRRRRIRPNRLVERLLVGLSQADDLNELNRIIFQ